MIESKCKKKRGSNLKGRLFRKSRKSRRTEVPQPLSCNPLKIDIGDENKSECRHKYISKKCT